LPSMVLSRRKKYCFVCALPEG